MDSKDVVTIKPEPIKTESKKPEPATPAMLLNIAIEKGADLEKLEKLMDLQVRWEANQARKSYTEAMSAFKKDPPKIEKDSHVEYKTTTGIIKYDHASLSNVTTKINAALSAHGLSASWETTQNEKGVSVTCKITHVLGHSESTTLTAANDSSGGKNAIQALGSTVSYLERYTILALTGLATHDMDDDGAPPEYIDDKQVSTIMDYIDSKKVNKEKFLLFMDAETVETIQTKDFNKAIESLKLAKGKAA